jgi:hypothetical protein
MSKKVKEKEWIHLVITSNGKVVTIYLNGEKSYVLGKKDTFELWVPPIPKRRRKV